MFVAVCFPRNGIHWRGWCLAMLLALFVLECSTERAAIPAPSSAIEQLQLGIEPLPWSYTDRNVTHIVDEGSGLQLAMAKRGKGRPGGRPPIAECKDCLDAPDDGTRKLGTVKAYKLENWNREAYNSTLTQLLNHIQAMQKADWVRVELPGWRDIYGNPLINRNSQDISVTLSLYIHGTPNRKTEDLPSLALYTLGYQLNFSNGSYMIYWIGSSDSMHPARKFVDQCCGNSGPTNVWDTGVQTVTYPSECVISSKSIPEGLRHLVGRAAIIKNPARASAIMQLGSFWSEALRFTQVKQKLEEVLKYGLYSEQSQHLTCHDATGENSIFWGDRNYNKVNLSYTDLVHNWSKIRQYGMMLNITPPPFTQIRNDLVAAWWAHTRAGTRG